MVTKCLHCDARLEGRSALYCSNLCQADQRYARYIDLWKQGDADGNRGKQAKNISKHIRRYLFEKYRRRCSICSWGEINPTSGNSPLEVDHIDGNSDNNSESNLRLICPNCHSLTPNFRNLNKGKGREWRRLKYVKVTPP